jgi:hypothetical protein
LLWFVLVSQATAQSELENSRSSSAQSSSLSAFFHEPFQQPLGYAFLQWNAKERILGRFGNPVSEFSSQYSARTSDEQLWSTKLEYKGITFVIGESEDRVKTWLQSIDIRGKEHILAHGLRVGSSRSDVVEAFCGAQYIEYDGGIRFSAEIWEARGEVVLETAMELQIDIGDDDVVTRFLIESIEL